MKTSKLNKILTRGLNTLLLSGLLFGTQTYALENTTSSNVKNTLPANGSFLKVSYVDLSAVGSLALVNPMSAYAASDIIVFAFADPSSANINNNFVSNMKAIETAAPNAQFFLSVGGAISKQMLDGVQGGKNIATQVNTYRSLGIRIDGVDMDFEHGEIRDVLVSFAQSLKGNTHLLNLSVAPQLVNLDRGLCSNGIDTSSLVADGAQCLGLSSGGINDAYEGVVSSTYNQYVNYIFAQAYNTPDFTINGYNETNVEFYTAAATALHQYALRYNPNIKIAIGEPANRAAGSPAGTIYGSSPNYNQASILSQLKQQINASLSTPNIVGTMMWSTNADYDPADYGDVSAKQGAYTTTIFGGPAPAQHNFQIQFSNNSSSKGAVITLIVNGTYYAFYNSQTPNQSNPIPAGQYALWASMDASGGQWVNSLNLNQIEPGSSYRVQVSLDSQGSGAWICPGTYSLTSGYHNIQVNNDYKSCQVS